MGGPRRKNLIARRRRTDDDGEEEGSVVAGIEDDSSSLGSPPTEVDNDADADGEGSDASENTASRKSGSKKKNGYHHVQGAANGNTPEQSQIAKVQDLSSTTADTEAMINGLKMSEEAADNDAINFDDTVAASVDPMPESRIKEQHAAERAGSGAERRRREHEEYKKKRDEDPAFVPNRGGFFMHDQRTAASSHNGFRSTGRGRGRGRAGIGAPPLNPHIPSNLSDAPWSHDLHDTVANVQPTKAEPRKTNTTTEQTQQSRLPVPPLSSPPPNRSFSKTTQVGNAQVRVFIPGMKSPVTFPTVPVNSHTRLPHHRPPLRRDKPVRVSLPEWSPRYIFPATDRSFIFIPRAMRPNQQGFGRPRGKGSFSGYANYPSARNSIFGGSTYSPSVAMSRRSSFAREMGRDSMVSPAASVMSRNRSIVMDATKPVVRLPPATDSVLHVNQHAQASGFINGPVSVVNMPQPQVNPLPQKPMTQNWSSALPMHQPRPQKQVSVADIESPAALNFPPPQQQQQQPFHHQMPAGFNGQSFPPDSSMLPHSRRPSHPSQRGTPLSQIPERAIHAQPFQPPYAYQQPQAFYPQQYPAPVYYYTAPGPPMAAPAVTAPAFVPGQQYPYLVPTTPMATPHEPTAQPGTVAHESNGMVYYYDSSQLAATATDDPSGYQTMAFMPSTGYMLAPHQGTVFYPPQ